MNNSYSFVIKKTGHMILGTKKATRFPSKPSFFFGAISYFPKMGFLWWWWGMGLFWVILKVKFWADDGREGRSKKLELTSFMDVS